MKLERNDLGCLEIAKDGQSDCLAIALCCYYSGHMDRPENDEENEDNHYWGDWVIKKTDEALDYMVEQLKEQEVRHERMLIRQEKERQELNARDGNRQPSDGGSSDR